MRPDLLKLDMYSRSHYSEGYEHAKRHKKRLDVRVDWEEKDFYAPPKKHRAYGGRLGYYHTALKRCLEKAAREGVTFDQFYSDFCTMSGRGKSYNRPHFRRLFFNLFEDVEVHKGELYFLPGLRYNSYSPVTSPKSRYGRRTRAWVNEKGVVCTDELTPLEAPRKIEPKRIHHVELDIDDVGSFTAMRHIQFNDADYFNKLNYNKQRRAAFVYNETTKDWRVEVLALYKSTYSGKVNYCTTHYRPLTKRERVVLADKLHTMQSKKGR